MNNFNFKECRNQSVSFLDLKSNIRIEEPNSANSNTRNSRMQNFILTILFIAAFAFSAFAAPVAIAGSNFTVKVGEAIRLDGSASSGYVSQSQALHAGLREASTTTIAFATDASLPSGTLTRYGNILPMGNSNSIDKDKTGPRTVLKESATSYKMWYEAVPAPNASTVGYATSTDGKIWTKQGSVLSPSAVWEGGAAGEISPNTVLLEGGVYRMWYHSFGPDGKRRIGYATSPNGISWTKNPEPVLNVGNSGSFDDYMVVEPRVFKLDDGSYRMYYGGMRDSERDQYRLMMAISSDGITWIKTNQVLFGPSEGAGFGIVKDVNQWHMWYDQDYNTLNYASSTDGLSWTPGPNNPVLGLNPNPEASDSQGIGDSISAYKDGNEFRVMYTGGRYNSFGRNESIHLAITTVHVGDDCSYSISSASQNFSATGGIGSASIETTPTCGWTVTTSNSWITIDSNGSGSGNGIVFFTVQPNYKVLTRTGTISIGTQTFTIIQQSKKRKY